MRRRVFDTDAFSLYRRGNAGILSHLAENPNMEEVAPHLARFPMLPVTEAAMARYRILKKAKINIGASDLQIAALALEYDAILVTLNLRDFQRVPGLTVEDWAS